MTLPVTRNLPIPVPLVVPGSAVPQRVLISKPAGAAFMLSDEVGALVSVGAFAASSNAFLFASALDATAVFLLTPGQPLYAARLAGIAAPLSIHYADADDLFAGPRVLGVNHAAYSRRVDLRPITSGAPPYPLAKAPPDSMLRVLIRNLDAVSPVFLSDDPNDLVATGLARNQYALQPGASVFLLAPGQSLFAGSPKVGFGPGSILPITAHMSRGALYGDVYLVQ